MSELNVTGKMAKIIIGCSLRTAQHYLMNIRKELGKYKGQCISLKEFCVHKSIEMDYASRRLEKHGIL